MTAYCPRVMGLHCAARGLGFAVFDGRSLHDWGTIVAHGDKNAMALRKLGRLLDRFSPEVLVIEEPKGYRKRSARTLDLYREIGAVAVVRNIEFYLHSHADIRKHLGLPDQATRQAIAETVALRIDYLALRLPRSRRAWEAEPRRLAVFSAAAVALTHVALDHDFRREAA